MEAETERVVGVLILIVLLIIVIVLETNPESASSGGAEGLVVLVHVVVVVVEIVLEVLDEESASINEQGREKRANNLPFAPTAGQHGEDALLEGQEKQKGNDVEGKEE